MGILVGLRQFLSGTRDSASSEPPVLLAQRSSSVFIILTVCLALFTDIFYYALIIPVIPFSLTVRVGLAEDQVQQWTSILLSCYSLALFVSSPVVGYYADHTSSRRWPMLIGLVALAGSTVLLCLGRTIWLLVLGRILQGFSAAVVWSVGCALLVDTVESAVGVAMGYVAIAMSVALLVAPMVGGAVYAAVGYFAVYYIAFGVIFLDIIMRLAMIEKKVAKQWRVDGAETEPDGIALRPDTQDSAAEQGLVLRDIEKRPSTGAAPATGLAGSVLTRGGGEPEPRAAEVQSEKLHWKNRPAFILIRSPRLIAALYGIVVQAGLMMGFDAVIALFVKATFGWNSTAAGLMFLAVFTPGFIAPVVGWLSDRYGARWLSFAGFIAAVPTIICLRFVTENTIAHKVLLAVLLAILGVALTFSNTPLMAEVSYVISERAEENPGIFGEKGVYGLGYGLFTMAFALGGVFGPLWSGYINAGPGWGTMTWSLALWSASGGLVAVLWLGGKPKTPELPPSETAGTV